jgi:nucleotidyltransferase/DNA polymerase involved in DNA repair
VIIHLDADAFYVSVEQAERPDLRGKMVAVGGQQRGIIASASYEARRMGVYTPMPTAKARKLCPGLIIVSGSMQKYSRVSHAMFAIIEDFTPYIERTSIDEGYFDVSGHRTLSPLEIAGQMKARIRAELGITVSLGIGSNKLVSQIASKLRKPDALVEVPRGTEREFLAPLEAHWLPGVGAKLAAQLRQFGFRTVHDVAVAPPALLEQAAGSFAPRLRSFARGEDDRSIEIEHGDAKSYGTQDTFHENISDREEILRILRTMADRLMASVRGDGKAIRTVSVKVRYADFTDHSHAATLPGPTDLETDLFPLLEPLLRGAWKRREPLRLVSLRVSNVTDAIVQQELALDPEAKRRAKQHEAARLLDELRARSLPITRGHGLSEGGK